MTVDAEPAHAVRAPSRHRWVGLTGLLLAEAMNMLDATITTVAAPVIRADVHGSASSVQWIAAAYTLPFAIALIPGGRLGDIHGRRRILLLSLTGFLAASMVCAAAPSMVILLPARAVQGVCAGLLIPQTIGLIKAMFDGAALGKALSLIGPVMGLTAVAGPVLGGVLTSADIAGLSWRTVFLVNLPLGLAVLASIRFLPEDRADRKPRVDVTGALIAAAVAAALLVPAIDAALPWWARLMLVGVGLVGVAGLVLHVRKARGRDPIIEPSLFHDRGFPAALLSSILYFAVSTGLVFVVVLYVQEGLGASVLAASLTVLPFSLGLAVASLFAGQVLLARAGPKLMLVGVGLLVLGCAGGAVAASLAPAVNFAPAANLSQTASLSPWLPVSLGLAGIGGGLVTVPFFTAALSRVRPHETGSAAGLLNSVQQLGGTAGVAGLGAVYLHHTGTPGRALAIVFGASVAITLMLAMTAAAMLSSPKSDSRP